MFTKRWLLAVLALGTIAMMLVMAKTGAPLKTSKTPLGILELELPFKKSAADSVINVWKSLTPAGSDGKSNIEVAKTNTWWDFLFIFFYSLFLYVVALKLSNHFTGSYQNWCVTMGNMAFSVAALDICENIGMFMMLNGNTSDWIVLITSICSAVKWLIVIAVLLFLLLTGILVLYNKVLRQK